MPLAPRRHSLHGTRAQHEKGWASRQNGNHALYNLWIWRKPGGLRAQVLARDPLCVECLKDGKLTPATEADHKEPHNGDYEMFVDIDGCQGLCRTHHAAKSRREQISNGINAG